MIAWTCKKNILSLVPKIPQRPARPVINPRTKGTAITTMTNLVDVGMHFELLGGFLRGAVGLQGSARVTRWAQKPGYFNPSLDIQANTESLRRRCDLDPQIYRSNTNLRKYDWMSRACK